jgi:hypothetical protein
MIVRNDKSYETNSLFSNLDWYNEDNYVVDETEKENIKLIEKIKEYAPYFDFVLDNEGNLIDITQIEKPFILPTEEEINRQVRDKIAGQYDYTQEIQMLNKGLLNANDAEYLVYKTYRQKCIDWGISEKQKHGYI